LAYAGLADCSEFRIKGEGHDHPFVQFYLAKALALDSTLAEALALKGLLQSHQDHDWTQAKKTLQKAIAFNPNYPPAHLYYGNDLLYTGENKDLGIEETKKAVELDPLSPWVNWVLGRNYFMSGQYDLAHDQLLKTLSLDSNFVYAKGTLGLVLLEQKKYAQAIELISRIREHVFEPDRGLELSYAYAVSGDKARARAELKRTLQEKYNHSDYQIARVYVALGEYDEAIAKLEKACEKREVLMWMVYVEPILHPLKNEPRFQALMKKMNLIP